MCLLQLADLSLPMALCEPVTDMQRRGDFLENVELLHEVSLVWLKYSMSGKALPARSFFTCCSGSGLSHSVVILQHA